MLAMSVGRPLQYKNKEEMQRLIDLYFLACKVHREPDKYMVLLDDLSDEDLLVINDIDDVHPTVTGLGLVLDLSRQGLINYEVRDEFVDTIKRAKNKIEAYLEQSLHGTTVTGVIFNLKNNYKWQDKHETELSGPDGKPIDTKWTFEVVDAPTTDS